MRFGFGWRLEGAREVRRLYARIRGESNAAVLLCANHLTMLDSFVIAWALASPWWLVVHYASLPWNTPDREHFASTWWKRALVYVMKCIPVERGGDRRAIGAVLDRLVYLLERGDVALVFPEGGRSRSGRVDAEATTYGSGRVVKALPGCRVLCLYLRGRGQHSWSSRPAFGERFALSAEVIEPKTDQRGLRGSLDISRQILARLEQMERRHFDGGQ